MRPACRVLFALLAGVAGARAGIVMTVEQPPPSSADVRMRWEAEGPGPFTLLRKEVADGGVIADAIPLDRLADVRRTGLTGGSVLLPAEATFAPGIDAHVYQLVDESDGSCSNIGCVAVRRGLHRDFVFRVAVPGLTSLRSLGAILDSNPAIEEVRLADPPSCRLTTLRRGPGGSHLGLDALVPPGKGVTMLMSFTADILITGASDPRHAGTRVSFSDGTCNMDDIVSLPIGLAWRTPDEIFCGTLGTDWVYEGPDLTLSCPHGTFEGRNGNIVTQGGRHAPAPDAIRIVGSGGGFIFFTFPDYRLDPLAGQAVGSDHPRRESIVLLDTRDLGIPAACRCADGDGDGSDDCVERLEGTDPADPSSSGPDTDGDGVGDEVDDCPIDADPSQADRDSDGWGDACDPAPDDPDNVLADRDGDGVRDGQDRCPDSPDPGQEDGDRDRIGDACDGCPDDADPSQVDTDADGEGDVCDRCPADPVPDTDQDFACSGDNCPRAWNPFQEDADGDGFGDECECADRAPLPPLQGLRITTLPFVLFQRELTWPASLDRTYDVASGPLVDVFGRGDFSTTACAAQGLTLPRWIEGPSSGDLYFIVRSRGACDATSWGSGSRPARDPRSALDGASSACP